MWDSLWNCVLLRQSLFIWNFHPFPFKLTLFSSALASVRLFCRHKELLKFSTWNLFWRAICKLRSTRTQLNWRLFRTESLSLQRQSLNCSYSPLHTGTPTGNTSSTKNIPTAPLWHRSPVIKLFYGLKEGVAASRLPVGNGQWAVLTPGKLFRNVLIVTGQKCARSHSTIKR